MEAWEHIAVRETTQTVSVFHHPRLSRGSRQTSEKSETGSNAATQSRVGSTSKLLRHPKYQGTWCLLRLSWWVVATSAKPRCTHPSNHNAL